MDRSQQDSRYTVNKGLRMGKQGRTVLQKLHKSVLDRINIRIMLILSYDPCHPRI